MKTIVRQLREILTRREKMQVGLLLAAIIAMAFSQAIGVASVLPFISLVMDQNLVFENRWLSYFYHTFNFTSISRFIIFIGVAMFVIIVLSNAISALATWLKLRFVWMNNHRLSRRLLEKYLSMPYAFFLNQNSADLSKNVLSEVNNLTNSYLIPLLNVITRSLVTLFMLAMLFWVNVTATLIAIVFLGGVYAAIFLRVNRNLKARGKLRMEANRMRFKTVNEAFGGIKEVKVMNREPYFLKSFSHHSYRLARLMSWNAVIGQIPRFALEAVAFGGIIIFVLVLLLRSQNAAQVIPLVTLFALAGYRLMPSLQDLFTSFTQMQFNRAVLDRIYNDFKREEKEKPQGTYARLDKKHALPLAKQITLKDISFYYPNTEAPVLSGLSLTIPVNSSVAFVGATGAGKTTLVDLILGLLTPTTGTLAVDGTPITKENIIKWQKNIGYVPQHIFLSDDTIANNIAFGISEKDINLNTLESAARIANIHNFIAGELPQGYNTLVGERGIRLSGGQRQRIGIARALYANPSVLVFDEATSALDGVTEDAVLEAMQNAARLKTLIIIAHRFTTVKNCNTIYMLEQGKIVAEGTYSSLMQSNEQFQKMAKVGSQG